MAVWPPRSALFPEFSQVPGRGARVATYQSVSVSEAFRYEPLPSPTSKVVPVFKKLLSAAFAMALGAPIFADDAKAEKDIVETAIEAKGFTKLVAAVKAAELVDTLKGAGPFTVFAPTDEAFAKLPAGTVEALLKDIPKLTSILTYHVVSGKVLAADVVKLDGKEAKTVQGGSVKISTAGGVKLNGTSNVVTTDIECTNGVIHVIDGVILPS